MQSFFLNACRGCLFVSFLMLFTAPVYAQYERGSCQNPYVLSDTVISVTEKNTHKNKVWFVFTAPKNRFLVEVYAQNMEVLDYMIFKYSSDDFCEAVSRKQLIPERNKVCSDNVTIDAPGPLSYENIRRGICNCPDCCYSIAYFEGVQDQTYAIVVYGSGNMSVKVATEAKALPVVEKQSANPFDIDNIEVGQAIVLDNIYFHGGRADILRTSYSTLNELYDFLESNKRIEIEIQGHVNAPSSPLDINHSDNLGGKRAKAVYDFLVRKGINSNRLSYKGYGNTQMVYPNAVRESEMARNRRVEILILSK